MNAEKLIKILEISSKLKQNTRHSWLASGRRESIAEHSWRLSLFAYFVKDEFPNADIDRVVKMCVFHDMGEAFTGDIPSFIKTNNDETVEEDVLQDWINSLPEPYTTELTDLFKEMYEQKTIESKIFKSLDKLECAIAHNEADLRTWLPLEYELNPNYGMKESQFAPFLKEFQEQVHNDSIEKIKKEKRKK